MPFFESLPDNANPRDLFLAHERVYMPFTHFLQELMRGPSALTIAERETIAAYVSGLNACSFCYGAHTAIAEAFGVDSQLLQSLMTDVSTAPVSEKLRPMLVYSKKLTLEPARMVQSDIDPILAAGWDEAAFHDAVAVCCMFNYMNRLVFAFGLTRKAADFKPVGKMVKKYGYRLPSKYNLLARYFMQKALGRR